MRRVLFGLETPWIGESLVGAVRRCADENGLTSVVPLLAEACASGVAFSNLAIRDDLDPERLASCMRVSVEEVASRLHRVVSTRSATTFVDFFGATIPASQMDLGERRISIAALAKSPYHRALWHHSLIPFDGQTGEILLDACPFCGSRLGWGGGGPPDLCNSCGCVIRDIGLERVSKNALRRSAPMLALLDPDPGRRARFLRNLHPDLAALDRGFVFELGRRIARAATFERGVDELRGSRRSRDEMIRLLEVGGDMIAGWPDAPKAFAAKLLGAGGHAASAYLASFRSIANGWDALPDHADLLRRRLPELLEPTPVVARALSPGSVTTTAAGRILGAASKTFIRCVRSNGIEMLSVRGTANLHKTFDEAALIEARDLLSDALTFASASERLGIPRAAIESLVAAGVLVEIRHPVACAMRKDRILSRSTYDAFIDRLRAAASPAVKSPIPIGAALNCVGGRQKPWSALFAALIDGTLPFMLRDRTSRSQRLVDLIVVSAEVGPIVAEMTDDRYILASERSSTMPRRDAEWMLNINPRCLIEATRAELAPAVNTDGDLIVERVLDVARTRISGAEISARFMGGSRKMPDALRVAGLPRLGVTGWDRAAVEALLSPASVATASNGPSSPFDGNGR